MEAARSSSPSTPPGGSPGHEVRLADSSPDLIGCYAAVRDRPGAVIAELTRLADAHARDGRACYYAVRERFNEARETARRNGQTRARPRSPRC